MSLPLFLVDALPAGATYRLDGAEGHHAATVQRLRPGERLILSDGSGGLVSAEIAAAGKGVLDLALGERRQVPPARPRLVVAQGIAKSDRGELAVQAMTEVGVDEIVAWSAARSVARWNDQRPLERWRATVREAAKQARRAWVPVVAPAVTTAALARRVGAPGVALAVVLHEEATTRLSTMDLPASGEIVLVVGPEGGVAPEELAVLAAAGAVAARLGTEVLRTSTAGVAALSVLAARLGRW